MPLQALLRISRSAWFNWGICKEVNRTCAGDFIWSWRRRQRDQQERVSRQGEDHLSTLENICPIRLGSEQLVQVRTAETNLANPSVRLGFRDRMCPIILRPGSPDHPFE